MSLESLQQEIKAERAKYAHLSIQFGRVTLDHVNVVGQLFIQAKPEVKKQGKKWQQWLKETCPDISARKIGLYMQVSKKYEELATVANFENFTLSDVQKLLNKTSTRKPRKKKSSEQNIQTNLEPVAMQILDWLLFAGLNSADRETLLITLKSIAAFQGLNSDYKSVAIQVLTKDLFNGLDLTARKTLTTTLEFIAKLQDLNSDFKHVAMQYLNQHLFSGLDFADREILVNILEVIARLQSSNSQAFPVNVKQAGTLYQKYLTRLLKADPNSYTPEAVADTLKILASVESLNREVRAKLALHQLPSANAPIQHSLNEHCPMCNSHLSGLASCMSCGWNVGELPMLNRPDRSYN
jgi:hypothetical protein